MTEQDVGNRGASGALFRNGTFDFLAGWLLGYAQQGGVSPGALLDCFARIRNGDPGSWVTTFADLARRSAVRAEHAERDGRTVEAIEAWSATQIAHRAVIAMADPRSRAARDATARMRAAFDAFRALRAPRLAYWEIPYAGTVLPAYVTGALDRADELLVIIGGGDTYVEDLWFFGAKDAYDRGRAVLVVDLPGQGDTPARDLHFGPATVEALKQVLAATRDRGFGGDTVLLGWSGGGIFTTHVAATAAPQDRIVALVASAPIHDPATFFARGLPRLLQRPPESVLVRTVLALARRNRVLRAALARYDWQFGPGGLAGIGGKLSAAASCPSDIEMPVLALVGLAEDAETLRQATEVVDGVRDRYPSSEVLRFDAASGGQAHCQVGNLPLALARIFDWLDRRAALAG